MRRPLPALVALLFSLVTCPLASLEAAEPAARPAEPRLADDYAGELPRVPAHDPAAAQATFKIRPGFQLQLLAAEPLVHDPVALCFDEQNRLFVVEMCDYSEQDQEFLGAVRLLEDTDGDGRYDRSTVYCDKLSWPTAVSCWRGGIFVGAAPDIWYFRDTDGDGRADEQRKVFTGFSRGNVQGMLNSFCWGLDHRIHGSASSGGGDIRPADQPQAQPVSVRGHDFAFDPETLEFAATTGGAQHGMCFDDWGHRFVCSNSDHIQLVMFEDRYLARNPVLAPPAGRISIAADGPQAEVFRISPVEPWRIVRTRLRVSGLVPGPVEGGGRAAGYFTSATGVTIFRGDGWPSDYRGNAFIGDVGSNIVHRKSLERQGLEWVARRADEGVEFLASSDNWFRPAQFANAPDGTLYIADVYREVIEHPASIPPVIKQHLDLTSGRDRGRIYRVVPDGFRQPRLPRLGDLSTSSLVAELASDNGWRRDTASRLLCERQDPQAVEPLAKLVTQSPAPLARLHALYALEAQRALRPELLIAALHDSEPGVRRHAIRLAERQAEGSTALQSKLLTLAGDPDPEVRYQLAFTLGELKNPARLEVLAELARRDAADRWMRAAIESSLSAGSAEVLARLLQDKPFRESEPGRQLLEELAGQIAARNQADELQGLASGIGSLAPVDAGLARQLIRAGAERLPGGVDALSRLLASVDKQLLDDLIQSALTTASAAELPVAARREAIESLWLAPWQTAGPLLSAALENRQPQEIQRAALATLRRFDTPEVATIVLAAWPGFSPTARSAAAEVIFSRPQYLHALLEAIGRDEFSPTDLEQARVKLLLDESRTKLEPNVRAKLAQALAGRRQDVLAAYQPALAAAGDTARGKIVFQKTCAPCHRLEGTGHEIGPNLATIQNRGAEAILVNVLDPSREVNPQYLNYVLTTTDGRALTGMIATENANSITLQRAEKQSDTVLRQEIDELRSTGLSIMPEGLEKEINVEAMADLIAYLLSVK